MQLVTFVVPRHDADISARVLYTLYSYEMRIFPKIWRKVVLALPVSQLPRLFRLLADTQSSSPTSLMLELLALLEDGIIDGLFHDRIGQYDTGAVILKLTYFAQ